MNIQYFYKFVQSQFPVKFSKDEIGKTSDKLISKNIHFLLIEIQSFIKGLAVFSCGVEITKINISLVVLQMTD